MNQIATVCLIFFSVVTSLSCSKSGSSNSPSSVTYEVTSLTGTWSGEYWDYSNGSQQSKSVKNQASGWKFSFTVPKGGQFDLMVSAKSDSGGSVSTAIYINGKGVATNTGAFGTATYYTLNQ